MKSPNGDYDLWCDIETIEEYIEWRTQWRVDYKEISQAIREIRQDHKEVSRTIKLRPAYPGCRISMYLADEKLEKEYVTKWKERGYALYGRTQLREVAKDMMEERMYAKARAIEIWNRTHS